MLYHLNTPDQPHQPQPPGGRQLCPTPEQLHRLDRTWVQLCARAGARPIPMELDNTVTTYASIEGSPSQLRAHPDVALLPEPAQRWVLGHQLGHHARPPAEERSRLWTQLLRAVCLVLAGTVTPLAAALLLVTGTLTGWHLLGLVATATAGLFGAAHASSRVRAHEAAADTYASRQLGITLTPETAAELPPHECPWPRLARLAEPWAEETSWAKRLAAHGPDPYGRAAGDTPTKDLQ